MLQVNDKYKAITFESRYREAFKAMNVEWIEKHFKIEKKDLDQLDAPEACLAGGGQIFFVIANGEAIATCALYKIGEHEYEIAKMAVRPDFRGSGLGHLLMTAAENWAVTQGARELLILSNTVLEPAIALYKKHGFITTHLGPHPDYERCNIEMRKPVKAL
ncbi:MAG: GNAT family N-acetyltransferase [Bdellovibrionales bacterium]